MVPNPGMSPHSAEYYAGDIVSVTESDNPVSLEADIISSVGIPLQMGRGIDIKLVQLLQSCKTQYFMPNGL